MPSARPDPFAPDLLRPTRDLRRFGESVHDLDASGRPKWTVVRRGIVVASDTWNGLTPEQRQAGLVHATSLQMTGTKPQPFSHTSAGAVWGLPRVSAWPRRIDVSVFGRSAHSSGLVRRHCLDADDALDPDDPDAFEIVDGLLVTPLVRTIVDLARTEDPRDAVAAADHALHHDLCTTADLTTELARVPAGARGRAKAAFVVRFAEPGAMSVGESLSRVQMYRLGLPRPQLQVPVADADGVIGIGDFWWERERVVGEFDGRKKYKVTEDMTPEEAGQTLWNEKRREDRIRATHRRMARWGWDDAMSPMRLVARLADQGVQRPARLRDTWFDAA
ncbi:hypothetical protein [Knoellia subterranea]|uniref:AbiEi antitoxin C-terminal domain-containing protein n=1 Tax=Knoellia subterranea KCTC 19937 TaxID=1385521 RepID=A0A0A0JMF2_9MICO|nr:hypothetical protein [Knoellia subterranea]KGN37242.1 hypothetical protein N803_15505 [Knoellia subterranea KCTC 19937]